MMRFQYGFYLILLLSASCNAEQTPKSLTQSTEKSKSKESVNQIDNGVELVSVTEEWALKMGMINHYKTDPGFTKWCVLFHDIPGNPPYLFEQKRLVQRIPNFYYPIPDPTSEVILESKNRNKPTAMVVSARGYLPGEKITIRLSSKDAYREVTFCPRPLLLKKESGELLVQATLVCADPGHTLYNLDICGVGKHEKYKLISHSKNEILSHNVEGPVQCGISPEVVGEKKGIAKAILKFENGTSYSLELPWGYELLEYNRGNK